MQQPEKEFSFYDLFVPLTTKKAVIFIVLVGLVVFFNALFNGFVWDDKTYIVFNTDIQSFNFPTLLKGNLFNAGGQYRPIPAIYFSVFHAVFKNSTFFYHLSQLTIHITNAIVLFFLFIKFFGKKLSFALTLVFLIHPIQVESVSFIAASDNPLFFLFGISALALSTHVSSRIRLVSITILLLLSLLTKEAAILFFIVIFFYQFLFHKGKYIYFFLSGGISLLIYCLVRFVIGNVYFAKLPLIPIARLTPFERLLNIPSIILYYIKTFFLPVQFAVDQQWVVTTINFQNFYFPLLIDVLLFTSILFVGLLMYKTIKEKFYTYIFFCVWFIVGLSLYLQIYPLDGTVADRWFYFPLVGLLGIIGTSSFLLKPAIRTKKIWYTLIGVTLVSLSILTIVRNSNWVDGVTLFSHDVQISDNFDIENNLATEYADVGNYKLAIVHSLKSVQMFPYEANLYNLANTYEQMEDIPQAKIYYAKALLAKNYLPIGHNHFLVTYTRLAYTTYLTNDFKNAKLVAEKGLQEYPNSTDLWIELAASEYKLGNQKEALLDAEKAKAILANQESEIIYSRILKKQPLIFQ